MYNFKTDNIISKYIDLYTYFDLTIGNYLIIWFNYISYLFNLRKITTLGSILHYENGVPIVALYGKICIWGRKPPFLYNCDFFSVIPTKKAFWIH